MANPLFPDTPANSMMRMVLRYIQSRPHANYGSIQIGGSSDSLNFSIPQLGVEERNISSALQALRTYRQFESQADLAGLREDKIFDMTKLLKGDMPRIGVARSHAVESIARDLVDIGGHKDGFLRRQVFNLGAPGGAESFRQTFQRGGTEFGLPVFGDGKVTLYRMFKNSTTEMTFNEVQDFLGQTGRYFLSSHGGDMVNKADKRMRRLFAPREMGMEVRDKGMYRVRRYDPTKSTFAADIRRDFEEPIRMSLAGKVPVSELENEVRRTLDEMAKKTTDGISHISRRDVAELISTQRRESQRFKNLAAAARSSGDHQRASELEKMASTIDESVGEYRRFARQGSGRMKLTMMGMVDADTNEPIFGQLKGHVIMGPRGMNYDIATTAESIGKEASYGVMRAGDPHITHELRHLSLEMHHAEPIVRTDIQSLIAHPFIYNRDQMAANSEYRIGKMTQNLKNGVLDEDLLMALRSMAEEEAGTPSSREWARRIISSYDRGELNLKGNAPLIRQIYKNTIEDSVLHKKAFVFDKLKDNFNIRMGVPGAIGAPYLAADTAIMELENRLKSAISPTERSRIEAQIEKYSRLSRNQYMFSPELESFVMHNTEMGKAYHPFGGGDLDDQLVAVLRKVENQEGQSAYRLFAHRRPTGMGQFRMVELANQDEFLEYYIGKNSNRYAMTQRLQRINAEIEDISGQLMGGVRGAPAARLTRRMNELDDQQRELSHVLESIGGPEVRSAQDIFEEMMYGIKPIKEADIPASLALRGDMPVADLAMYEDIKRTPLGRRDIQTASMVGGDRNIRFITEENTKEIAKRVGADVGKATRIPMTGAERLETARARTEAGHMIGMYFNAEMFTNEWNNRALAGQSVQDAMGALGINLRYKGFEQFMGETGIDTLISASNYQYIRGVSGLIKDVIERQQKAVGYLSAMGSLGLGETKFKLDPYAVDIKTSEMAQQNILTGIHEALEDMPDDIRAHAFGRMGVSSLSDVTLSHVMLDINNDAELQHASLYRMQRSILGAVRAGGQELDEAISSLPDDIMSNKFSFQEYAEGEEILKYHRAARRHHLGMKDYGDEWQELREELADDSDFLRPNLLRNAEDDTMAYIAENLSEPSGVIGQRAERALLAAQQMLAVSGKEPMFMSSARGRLEVGNNVVDLNALRERAISRFRGTSPREELSAASVLSGIDPIVSENRMGLKRAARLGEAAEESERLAAGVEATRDVFRRLDSSAMRDLLRTNTARHGLAAMGLLVGAGILYGLHRDRSPEDMTGPPLLPGGSAYEDYDGVPASMQSAYGKISLRGGFKPGAVFDVVVKGSNYSPYELGNKIQSITGGQMSGTIHKASSSPKSRRRLSSPSVLSTLTGN